MRPSWAAQFSLYPLPIPRSFFYRTGHPLICYLFSLLASSKYNKSIMRTGDIVYFVHWCIPASKRLPGIQVVLKKNFLTTSFLWYSFSKTHNHSLTVRISDKPKLKDILQNTWLVLFKTVKVMTNKVTTEKLSKTRKKKTNRLDN